MGQRFRITTPASTSNLGPGFDTLGLAVNLTLTVEVEKAAGFSVDVTGEGASLLPRDRRNRVLAAAREIAGDAVQQASWRIDSAIPMARGLGSSAAARAAGLAAGYALRDAALPPRHEIFDGVVQTESHPDNSAATVFGGFRVSGRVEGGWNSWPGTLQTEDIGILLIIPGVPVSTQQARSILPTTYSRSACVRNLQHLAGVLSGLARGDWQGVRASCLDQLHEPYRLPLVPGLSEALQALRDHPDTGGAYLSGAGPILAAFLPDPKSDAEVGAKALAELQSQGTQALVQVARLEPHGLRLEKL